MSEGELTSGSTEGSPHNSSGNNWRMTKVLLVLILLAALANWWVWKKPPRYQPPQDKGPEAPQEMSFSDSSTNLKNTLVVPTLDTPVSEGKSALWCTTTVMAWQQMEKEAFKEPLLLEGAEEISRSLGKANVGELEKEHYYVAAGWSKDGIWERIAQELPKRFSRTPKLMPPPAEGGMAFAYLEASVLYQFQFNHSNAPLLFKDSQGKETKVHAFGIRPEDKEEGVGTYRSQVEVLFRQGDEFAIDLSRQSKPYQIILARIPRAPSLQATLDELAKKTKNAKRAVFSEAAVLLVPSMYWKVEHHFRELEGRHFLNPKYRKNFLNTAYQFLQFKMDRKGAWIASGAHTDWDNGHDLSPDEFPFNCPFLLVMKKRGTEHPFLVMWIDNAELLQLR